MGSGTTAVAASKEGRQYIGIEKEKKYVLLAKENVKYSQVQSSLFDTVKIENPHSAIPLSAAIFQN
jgi:DNA modification methylase